MQDVHQPPRIGSDLHWQLYNAERVVHTFPDAENVNYWQTGQSSPDTWIEKAKRQVQQLGGTVEAEGFGAYGDGRAAFMLQFSIGGDQFKTVWPVLTTRSGKERAARVQAATFLYHDIKAKALAASVLGPRAAFFPHLMLSDGRMASQLALPELEADFPKLDVRPQVKGYLNGETA